MMKGQIEGHWGLKLSNFCEMGKPQGIKDYEEKTR